MRHVAYGEQSIVVGGGTYTQSSWALARSFLLYLPSAFHMNVTGRIASPFSPASLSRTRSSSHWCSASRCRSMECDLNQKLIVSPVHLADEGQAPGNPMLQDRGIQTCTVRSSTLKLCISKHLPSVFSSISALDGWCIFVRDLLLVLTWSYQAGLLHL